MWSEAHFDTSLDFAQKEAGNQMYASCDIYFRLLFSTPAFHFSHWFNPIFCKDARMCEVDITQQETYICNIKPH